MSFTPINSGDHVSSTLETSIEEFKVALNEREAALEITQTTGWSASAHILTRALDCLSTIRSSISDLIAEQTAGTFVRSSDYTVFSDIDDLLDDAGYSSGWIATAGMSISTRSPWIQLQDVFAALIIVRKKKTASSSSDSGLRYATYPNNETAWDAAKADTPVDTYQVHNYWAGWTSYIWQLGGPVKTLTYDTSGWNGSILGSFHSALHKYQIRSNGPGTAQFTASIMGGEQTFVVKEDGSNDGVFSTAVVGGFSFGVDYQIDSTIDTVEPGAAPMTPYSPVSAVLLSFGLSQTSALAYNAPVEFRFDITSILTYG